MTLKRVVFQNPVKSLYLLLSTINSINKVKSISNFNTSLVTKIFRQYKAILHAYLGQKIQKLWMLRTLSKIFVSISLLGEVCFTYRCKFTNNRKMNEI